jgi:hypothetical protein
LATIFMKTKSILNLFRRSCRHFGNGTFTK